MLQNQKLILIEIALSAQFLDNALEFSLFLVDVLLHLSDVLLVFVFLEITLLKDFLKFFLFLGQPLEFPHGLLFGKHGVSSFHFYIISHSFDLGFILLFFGTAGFDSILHFLFFLLEFFQLSVVVLLIDDGSSSLILDFVLDSLKFSLVEVTLTFKLSDDFICFVVFVLEVLDQVHVLSDSSLFLLDLGGEISIVLFEILSSFGGCIGQLLLFEPFSVDLSQKFLHFSLIVVVSLLEFLGVSLLLSLSFLLLLEIVFILPSLFLCVLLESHGLFPLVHELLLDHSVLFAFLFDLSLEVLGLFDELVVLPLHVVEDEKCLFVLPLQGVGLRSGLLLLSLNVL